MYKEQKPIINKINGQIDEEVKSLKYLEHIIYCVESLNKNIKPRLEIASPGLTRLNTKWEMNISYPV